MAKSALNQLKEQLKPHRVQKQSKKASSTKQLANRQQRSLANKALTAMRETHQKSNPFDLKFTKQKHDILGRKPKGIVGNPGLARKRGLEQRKQTIAVEMTQRNRTSLMVDRRIGQEDANMSVDEKMLARLMKEKTKQVRNSNAFNLEVV